MFDACNYAGFNTTDNVHLILQTTRFAVLVSAIFVQQCLRMWDSSFITMIGLWTWRPRFDSQLRRKLFSLPLRPNQLWVPSNFISIEYQGLFPRGYSDRSVKLISIHLRLVFRLRMRGTIPPLPYTSSWRGI